MQTLFNLLSSSTKLHVHEYVNIEANIGKSTFINKDGSYSTFFEIEGAATPVGKYQLDDAVREIESRLEGTMKKKGFRIQFVFEKNPEKSHLDLEPNFNPVLKNLDKIGLSPLKKVIDSRDEAIGKKVMFERCYMVITTFTTVMNPRELKEKTETRDNELKKSGAGIKPGAFSQSPMGGIKELLNKHNAFTNQVFKTLRQNLMVKLLNCHEAIHVIVEQLNNHKVHKGWAPSLLGDPIRPRLVKDNPNALDQSHVMNMDIGFQIFNKIPQIPEEDITAVHYGDLYYKPLNMDMPPTTVRAFSELFSNIDDDIPWRMSLTIESGHDEIKKKISSKKTWATLLAITNSVNKEIKKAAEEFIDLCENDETLCSTKISFSTWGKTIGELSTRTSSLIESIQGWGSGNVIEELGDPIELWLNMLPGVSRNMVATSFPVMIREAFTMSPISRPASAWKTGPMVYRTYDKKIFPYAPMSSKQQSWNDIYYAPPGSGKSFKLAADNLALIANPANTLLPRISIIDIGFSSGSFVDFIKACLPDDKKDLAQSFKLEMVKGSTDNNINVFDTPLGCRKPLATDREFLINFLSMLFTPASSNKAPDRMDEICGPLIDEMYDYLSDDREPNMYQVGISQDVDDKLNECLGEPGGYLSWWNVVDILFEHGHYDTAAFAQRYAVPNLTDITTVISASKNLVSIFGDAKTETGERIFDFIKMMTVSAIGDYPILAQPSSFDIGKARIVSMDLSSVAPKGSGAAAKKTGLMYMTARYVLCKEFYRKEDETLPQIPDKYKEYHKDLLQKESGVYKKICMDEFHRTSDVQGVRSQVVLDIREGRKYNVGIALLSQDLNDFDKNMIEFTDNFYILSKGKTETVIRDIVNTFSPQQDSIDLLRKYVTGPDPDEGTAMLYLGDLKGGSRIEQVIYLTLSVLELWAYTTTREDYNLRSELTKKIGLLKTMDILVKEFPTGSAKDMIENFKESLETEEDIAKMYELVSNKLINKYYGI